MFLFFFIYILQYLFRVTICKLHRSSINIHYFYYLFLLLNTQDSVEENQTRKPNSLLTPVTPVTVASVCQSKVPARLRLTVLTTRMAHALLISHLQNRDSTWSMSPTLMSTYLDHHSNAVSVMDPWVLSMSLK